MQLLQMEAEEVSKMEYVLVIIFVPYALIFIF